MNESTQWLNNQLGNIESPDGRLNINGRASTRRHAKLQKNKSKIADVFELPINVVNNVVYKHLLSRSTMR